MRDITALHPEVQVIANKLVEKCREQGLIIKITDCVRTKEEQDALYAQGRTRAGSIITNVTYPRSNHCWGIAFDFCRNDGTGAYNDTDGFFTKVGQIGKSLGLFWGGDWTSIKDKPHFQLETYGTWSSLQAKYGTPSQYFASWGGSIPVIQKEEAKVVVNDDIVAIKALQKFLNKKGFRDNEGKKLVEDGLKGNKTVFANTKFLQTMLNKDGHTDAEGRKLYVDGYKGEKTEQAMRKVICKMPDKDSKGRNIWKAPKNKGNVVFYIQTNVNTKNDKYYGFNTQKAVIRQQANHNISQDGITGFNTLNSTL
ncbi:M15 family metallopeptidase [Anaerosacchariphilus polymeriproducens]|uniref:Uncharacterized protein n=1 Tax=Anaerosacchariphilus polymeriproducens TaxID=1812858 RepID=A0A371AT59_9FIRM|nr:M15 family metallopeptidase [Anaerosacchariphilus polymeriproducens]RDU22751.1 hypothetical protein DWV06_13360 [Anaerosacchariphilus polymeriproducens]